jgi:hypothetical protein
MMARTLAAYSTTSQAPRLQQVWQAMRIMRGHFSVADLLRTCDISESAVHKYCRALARAGYLRLLWPRVSGRAGSRDIWALVRDSGPHAPIKRQDGSAVWDPNTRHAWPLADELPAAAVPGAAPAPRDLGPIFAAAREAAPHA